MAFAAFGSSYRIWVQRKSCVGPDLWELACLRIP
ncbi:MAG: hypothetical protein JWQ69_2594 [Pseudomonas sp.]|nr:hypothetical protein [Pseudomonas sp.]